MTTRVYLARHGETDDNAGGRTQGRREVPLNDRGRRQAAALAEALRDAPLAAVMSSPSERCRETARPVAAAHGLEVRVDERLLEIDQGDLDGLSFEDMRRDHAEFLRRWRTGDPTDVRMPGGETLGEAQCRVVEALEDLAREFPEQAVAVVGHNLAIKALLCRALAVPLAGFRRLRTDTGSLAVVEVRLDAPWTVVGINDRCHLEPLEARPVARGDG